MSRKLVLAATLTFVLMGMLGVALKVQRVEASETIYIMADGSIVPSTANITSADNITYTFIGNINESIVVERDNIVIDGAGYTLKGTGSGTGIDLPDRTNVTIRDLEIREFVWGIYLTRSSNNTISGNNIIGNTLYGIKFYEAYSYNNIISGNNITNSINGIGFEDSINNTISGNNIRDNLCGMELFYSPNNFIYHNNFVNNTLQVRTLESANDWDDEFEGNYWSNYTGVDSGHDGIGDTSHVIDENNQDNFPLMGMFHSFNIPLDYRVNVISNSTIEDFTFFEANSTIKMHVSNMTTNQTFGFCRVCIPKGLISPPYIVVIDDGLTEVLYFNGTLYDNGTYRWIYFAYEHSTHEVDIVPEFPTWTPVLLMLIVLAVAIAVYKRRLLKTSIH